MRKTKIVLGTFYALFSLLFGYITYLSVVFNSMKIENANGYILHFCLKWLTSSGMLLLSAFSVLGFAVFYLIHVIHQAPSRGKSMFLLIWIGINIVLLLLTPPQSYIIAIYSFCGFNSFFCKKITAVLIVFQLMMAIVPLYELAKSRTNA